MLNAVPTSLSALRQHELQTRIVDSSAWCQQPALFKPRRTLTWPCVSLNMLFPFYSQVCGRFKLLLEFEHSRGTILPDVGLVSIEWGRYDNCFQTGRDNAPKKWSPEHNLTITWSDRCSRLSRKQNAPSNRRPDTLWRLLALQNVTSNRVHNSNVTTWNLVMPLSSSVPNTEINNTRSRSQQAGIFLTLHFYFLVTGTHGS